MGSLSSDESLGKTPAQDPLGGLSEQPARTLVLSAYYENLEQVREFAAQAAKDSGLEPDDIYNVQLAVDEAFTNIVEHAYGGEGDDEIQCNCQIAGDGLTISLKDCGHPFDPESVPDPDLDSDLNERKVGGLGLFFIHELMDEVDFTFTIEAGTNKRCNIIKMVKRRANGD